MGLALLWKPAGPGSQDFLGDFKREMGLPGPARKDIGHSGTLDPFAEGLLLVGWDEGTKLLTPLTGLPKKYIAEICLGLSSETLDLTEVVSPWQNPAAVTKLKQFIAEPPADFFKQFLNSKIGVNRQRPPQYSAIKIEGQRAHELIRKGQIVEMPEREFTLISARHLSFAPPSALPERQDSLIWRVEVEVTAGTYIRALARDWAQEIFGEPAALSRLIRKSVGPYELDIPTTYIENPHPRFALWTPHPGLPKALVKPLELGDLGKIFDFLVLDASSALKLQQNGQWKPEAHVLKPQSKYLILDPQRKVIAWCEGATGKLGRVFRDDPLALQTPSAISN